MVELKRNGWSRSNGTGGRGCPEWVVAVGRNTHIARKGYKVRSTAGHHVKILEKLSQLLKDEDILVLGNKIRQERNVNLYDGGFFIGKKDSLEYLKFVKSVFEKAGI